MESRNQKRKCFHEENNLFDMFAIRVCDDVKIVTERYAEPKDEEVLGYFLALPPVGQACKRDTRSENKNTKRGRKTKENHHGQSQDIKQLFRKIAEKNEGKIDMVVEKIKNKTNTDPVTITID